jgi:bacteriocin biosynthesis cyclodehydratase domain-containing protein
VVLNEEPIPFPAWLEPFNLAAQDAGVPWLPVSAHDAVELHVGPTIVPGVTACFRCYELRYKSNLTFLDSYLQFETFIHGGGRAVDFGLLPPFADAAGALAALELRRALAPDQSPLSEGALVTVRTLDFGIEAHPVLKLPRCAACSPAVNEPAQRAWR